MQYFENAAKAGNPKANGCIGFLWTNGLGVEKDIHKGISFLEKSAMIGEVYSQYNLGLMYRAGEELEQDFDKALFWFKHAANRGLAAAQIDLSIMYIKGDGLEPDFSEAFKWVLLGEMNGDDRGDSMRTYCIENFDKKYLEEGQKRAQAFQEI